MLGKGGLAKTPRLTIPAKLVFGRAKTSGRAVYWEGAHVARRIRRGWREFPRTGRAYAHENLNL